MLRDFGQITMPLSPYQGIMGSGRNNINVLSSDVIIALPGKAGTISEIALALKNGKKVILLNFDTGNVFSEYRDQGILKAAGDPGEAIQIIKGGLSSKK